MLFKVRHIVHFIWVSVLLSCHVPDAPKSYQPEISPYEAYRNSLFETNLDSTSLGKKWLSAGTRSLEEAIPVEAPFREKGFFKQDEPMAVGYKFYPKLGQLFEISLQLNAESGSGIFLEIYEEIGDSLKRYKLVSYADSSTKIQYEVNRERPHIVRLQPELLISGKYLIEIVIRPTLVFPVSGKDIDAVGSVWGDPRDGGSRFHKGIDIFARRGTPAIAATDGYISRVGITPLGGKIVWLRDNKRRQHLYYAHLDSQIVKRGQKVIRGDTLGLIGNTGNAIRTAPHLHFGIYRSGRGPVNPYAHVHQLNDELPPILSDTLWLDHWMRLERSLGMEIRSGWDVVDIIALKPQTPVYVLGTSENYYRVRTPDGMTGFVESSFLNPAIEPLRITKPDSSLYLNDKPLSSTFPIAEVSEGSDLPVIGEFNQYLLVESPDGEKGWLRTKK